MPERRNGHNAATVNDARAGETGHHVRHVLAFGTLGVIVLFAGIYIYYFV